MKNVLQLANRMSRLGTESAFKVLAQAQALEAQGMDVVHMEIGEPDFATPGHIRSAAVDAMNNGATHYCNSQGLLGLRQEIARQVATSRGVEIDPSRVIVTPGAKPIMYYSMITLLNEGDEAIYPNPGFPIYESMINFCGAKAVPVPLREELDFRLDIDELKSLITPKTRLIVLNSPENPTSGVLAEKDIRAIADLAVEHDITILSDEVYEYIVYGEKPFSIFSLPGMSERTILLNGFSKTYAMTGWRLGYAVMPEEMIEPVVRLIVNSVSCTPPFIQQAGIAALTGPQDSISTMVNEFEKRRNLIVNGLNDIPGISCLMPKGAFYVFPNITKTGMSCNKFADYLLNDAGVATLPGTSFGKYGEGYLRMSFATSQDNIKNALGKMKEAVARL